MAALIKLALFVVLIYLAAKTVRNLARAVLHDPKAQDRVPPRDRPSRHPQWKGPQATRSRYPEEDVEDAKWVDLN